MAGSVPTRVSSGGIGTRSRTVSISGSIEERTRARDPIERDRLRSIQTQVGNANERNENDERETKARLSIRDDRGFRFTARRIRFASGRESRSACTRTKGFLVVSRSRPSPSLEGNPRARFEGVVRISFASKERIGNDRSFPFRRRQGIFGIESTWKKGFRRSP